MRACAILLESMVLSLSMSSGRMMPATISSLISKLTRISCLPLMTRLFAAFGDRGARFRRRRQSAQ
jgi:hypothetical protein